MIIVEWEASPRLFKAGWLRHQENAPFLVGADGAVSKFNKRRCAARFLDNRPALAF